MSSEQEKRPRSEEMEAESREQPEESSESNLEQLPTNTEMWSVMESKDEQTREMLKADKDRFHEEAAKMTFGSSAEFAANVAGMATIELKPFLMAFEELTREPPVPPEVEKGRKTVKEALDKAA